MEEMNMIEIATLLEYLFLIFAGLTILIFGIYGTLILYYGKVKKRRSEDTSTGEEYEPPVSVVVPTHNEASIMPKRIENLLATNYPKDKLEILFVDDSDDSTPQIIEQYSKSNSYIHLLRFNERMGYSPSLIAGCNAAKGEIIVFAEASSFLEPDTLHHLVKNFKDPKIGAVTGKDMLLNLDEKGGQSENSYLKLLDLLRQGESNMDSTVYMKGEAAAVRKALINDLDKLVAPGTADTAIALFVRSKGYRFVFDPEVKFYEYAPSTRKGRVKQKSIRAANLIKVLWSLRGLFFRRKYGKFGSIILPFNFAMLAIAPSLILLAALSLAALTFFKPIPTLYIWGIIGIILVIGLVVAKNIVITFFEFEYSLLKAVYEILFVRKSHDKIEKVESTRRSS
jgi:cellulose synthase/poly-beta-1,6-N-acetylglucosamine synthase-like glycosyltransferase